MRPIRSIPIRLLPVALSLATILAAPCAAEPTTVIIPPTTRIIRSDEAVQDSTFAVRRADVKSELASARVNRSQDATRDAWPWDVTADAWCNRPPDGVAGGAALLRASGATRAVPPALPGPPQAPGSPAAIVAAPHAWADALWLMIYLHAYNHRFGFPLGTEYDDWVRSWKTDCNPGG